jgi:hypothetical protein
MYSWSAIWASVRLSDDAESWLDECLYQQLPDQPPSLRGKGHV